MPITDDQIDLILNHLSRLSHSLVIYANLLELVAELLKELKEETKSPS